MTRRASRRLPLFHPQDATGPFGGSKASLAQRCRDPQRRGLYHDGRLGSWRVYARKPGGGRVRLRGSFATAEEAAAARDAWEAAAAPCPDETAAPGKYRLAGLWPALAD